MSLIEKIKSSQFYKDSFWAILGNGASKGLGMVAAIYIAEKLGSSDFGKLGMLRSTTTNFAIFSTIGLAYTATKFISDAQRENKYSIKELSNASLKITLIFGGIVGALLFLFSGFFSELLFKSHTFDTPIKITAVWIVFYSLVYTQIGVIAGLGLFKQMAKVNFWVGLYTFISGIALTYYKGLYGALIAFFSAYVLNYTLNYFLIRKNLPKTSNSASNKGVIMKMLKFSTPIALQESIYTIASWLMIFGLIRLSNDVEVGLFNASMQWSTLIVFLPSILRNVLLRNFTNNQKNEDKMVEHSLKLVFVITLIPSIILLFFQKPILNMYGNSYEGITPVISVILFASVFMGLNTVYNQSFISKNKNWLMFWMRFVRDVGILICAYFLLINKTFAPALSLSVSYLILNVLFFICGYYFHSKFKKEIIKVKSS